MKGQFMRYPAWTKSEDAVLIARWNDTTSYPTAGAIAHNFPDRSESGVHSRIKKLVDGDILKPREVVTKTQGVEERPTQKVLIRKDSGVALPYVPALDNNDKYTSKQIALSNS